MDLRKPYVITIVGAESSGKTTLAVRLAFHFQAKLVTEYAREYLSSLDRSYNVNDLAIIAENEIERINLAIKIEGDNKSPDEPDLEFHEISSQMESVNEMLNDLVPADCPVIIIDSGMLTLRMWARIKYREELKVVEESLQHDLTDLYLLCRPRNEWEPDPLREAPDVIERAWIYNQYLQEITKMKKDFRIVAV